MNKIFARKGFTLVELLVVIAIIAILAAIVILIVNPLEVTRRARDATRLADIAGVQNAINVTVQEATDSATDVLCNPAGGDPAPCHGSSTDLPAVTATKADGTGWVNVNLGAQTAVSVANLPLDPINTSGNALHFTYCSDGTAWEINTRLESQQHSPKMATDGGGDNASPNWLYETGSDPGLNLLTLDDCGGDATGGYSD